VNLTVKKYSCGVLGAGERVSWPQAGADCLRRREFIAPQCFTAIGGRISSGVSKAESALDMPPLISAQRGAEAVVMQEHAGRDGPKQTCSHQHQPRLEPTA